MQVVSVGGLVATASVLLTGILGVSRMAFSIVPMDDSKAEVSVDLSGRPSAKIDLPFSEFQEKE
jgi:imidazoleglycerol phosphate dehydratase HisB